MELKRNEVIAVVGDVRSGTSLLAAIMGQIKKVKGQVLFNRAACGFIPREPWLINASLRDNILFGAEEAVDTSAYNDAIRIAGLTRDFLLLSNGDETFINELNLSAAQKQRISIARCIIQQPDIILMEDCLADFDQNHGRRLFKECIKNQLSKSKCVVMVTQQMQFLPECDRILVMKNGKSLLYLILVVDKGTYLDLKSRHDNFTAWVSDVVHVDDDPTGLLEKINEIRLEPATSISERSKQISPMMPKNPQGPLSHLPLRRAGKVRSSPLASAKVITANRETLNEKAGIELLVAQNKGSIQNAELNERTISKLIERSQGSVLNGNAMRPPANFGNQDIVTRTIEVNQLTVHSVHTFDAATVEPGILSEAGPVNPLKSTMQFLREGTGLYAGLGIIFAFIISSALRITSGSCEII